MTAITLSDQRTTPKRWDPAGPASRTRCGTERRGTLWSCRMAALGFGPMNEGELLSLLAQGRVASLATIRSDGRVDLVPCTYAFEDDIVVTAVDHKPKTTMDLKRLDNVRRFPEVTLLVEHYDDADWERLWWVRIRGRAVVHTEGAQHRRAIELLCARYPQYAAQRPKGAAIVIQRTELTGWSALS